MKRRDSKETLFHLLCEFAVIYFSTNSFFWVKLKKMSKRTRSSDRDTSAESSRENKNEPENETKQKRARVSNPTFASPSPSPSPWTRLPSVLLEKICQHRNSCQQHAQFAMTCKTFQNAAKKPGSWHGHFTIAAQIVSRSKPRLFKLYSEDKYMIFDSYIPGTLQQVTPGSTNYQLSIADVAGRIKQVSSALAGVKVLSFYTETRGSFEYPEFFQDLFQHLNFKRITELDMESPMDITTLYNTITSGECKKLTNLTVSANLRQSPKQVKNTHSMLTRTLKHLVLEAPEWDDFDGEILRGLSVNFQVQNPALLPMIETLFLKNIYLETAAKSKFNLFRIDSCKRLSKLTLVNCSLQTPGDLLAVASTLKTLILQTEAESEGIPSDEELTQVILSTPSVTDLDIDLSDLERPISVELFAAMSELKDLKKLAMTDVEMENSSDFSNMTSLTSLYIHADESVNEASFPPSLLQLIWIPANSILGSHVINALSVCNKLEYLELYNPIIPNNKDCFATLVKLKTLILNGTVSIDLPVGGEIWKPTENGFFNLPRSLIHLELHDAYDVAGDVPDKIKLELVMSAIECKCPIVHLATDYSTKGILAVMRERAQKWILPIKRWDTLWSLHGQKHISIKSADLLFMRNEMKSLEQVKITYTSGKQNLEVDLFLQHLPSSVTSLEIKSLFDPNLASPDPQHRYIDKYANMHFVQVMKAILRLEPAKLPKLSFVKLDAIFDSSSVEIDKLLDKLIKDFTARMLQKWKTLTERDIVIKGANDSL